MKQIKNYLKNWGLARIIRLVLGGSLAIAYYYNGETIFLFAAIVFTTQAVLNMSCPGGACATNSDNNEKPVIKIKKYEPTKTER
jgi:hypothetical protein